MKRCISFCIVSLLILTTAVQAAEPDGKRFRARTLDGKGVNICRGHLLESEIRGFSSDGTAVAIACDRIAT